MLSKNLAALMELATPISSVVGDGGCIDGAESGGVNLQKKTNHHD
jgi:hypothetical protein